jgi:2-dehydro-3-deoxygalactonokinase
LIAIDWGTSSFRAFRLAADGSVLARRQAPRGILQVPAGSFADVLVELVGEWLSDGESHLLLSGMVGSRQGWREAAYVEAPAGIEELAGALMPVSVGTARGFIVPGLIALGAEGVPEIMRGEETQIAGVLHTMAETAIACLPGSHSKWARIDGGRITGFTTAMTGETFAALRQHTILGRLMSGEAHDPAAFDAGVTRSADPGGLLHHVFGARTLVITERLPETAAASYLSGILIGHDVRSAVEIHGRDQVVHLIGEPVLCELYGRALTACNATYQLSPSDAAVLGLARIGNLAPWT